MNPNTQVLLSVSVPTVAVLVGILVNLVQISQLGKRIDSLEAHMNAQLVSLRNEIMAPLLRVEQVMDARLKHLEERER